MKDKRSILAAGKHLIMKSLLGLEKLLVLVVVGIYIISIDFSNRALEVGCLVKNIPKFDAIISVAILTGCVSPFGIYTCSKPLEDDCNRQEYPEKIVNFLMGTMLTWSIKIYKAIFASFMTGIVQHYEQVAFFQHLRGNQKCVERNLGRLLITGDFLYQRI